MSYDPNRAKIFQCPKCGARGDVTATRNDEGPAYLCRKCRTLYDKAQFEANFLPDGEHPPLQPAAPDLSPPFEAHARSDDPDTAKAAAQAVSGKRATELEGLVIAVLATNGPLTAWQIAKRGNLEYGSTSPRLANLEKKGLVRRLGEKVVEGRKKSILWGLTA